MKKEKDANKTRRDFLKTGFAAVIAGTACFSFGGLKEALAAAKKAEKPLLTVDNLNALVPDEPNDEYFKLAKRALNDPLAFLKKYFYITDIQNEGLASLNSEDWEKIKNGIQIVIDKKYNFVVTMSGDRLESRLTGNVEIVKASLAMKNWEIEVSAEGGTKGNGQFEGKVGVKVKGSC
ncbi:MAG: hypothetical protein R2747_18890 [Pyrinomonadaceae bacterium]